MSGIDTSGITFSQDPTTEVVTMAGNAQAPVATDVAFTATLATTPPETLTGTVTRTIVQDVPTTLESFVDDHGGTWTISADGRSATPPAA